METAEPDKRVDDTLNNQRDIDISNLRLYARMAQEYRWQTDVIHWGVVRQTLQEIADRLDERKCGEREQVSDEYKAYAQTQTETPDKTIDALRSAFSFTQEARILLWKTLSHLKAVNEASDLARDISRFLGPQIPEPKK